MNRNKILLIEPPFYRLFKNTYSLDTYPLSLGYLSGTIKKETDWDVMCYNADFSPKSEPLKVSYMTSTGFNNYLNNLRELSGPIWNEVRSTISDYKPTVLGISAKSSNFASACAVARLAKEIDKKTIVIMGGPHPSIMGSDVLSCPDIDACIRGEGERTIVELLSAIASQRDFDGIRGVIYKEDGQIIENPQRGFIEDLDSLCFPHEYAPQVLKDYDRYPLSAFANVFATRGCPYNCFFCASRELWTQKVRFRSPENVVKEIKGLQNKGLKHIHFSDDTFGVNKRYIEELCNALITHCPGLRWTCETHVKLVDEETIRIMKSAGCYSITIGVESGNNEILKKIRKDITIEEALSAGEIIKKYGIKLKAYFIIGFPWETEDTLNDTVEAMKKFKYNVNYSIFTPYPGTEAFDFCKQKGLIGDDYDASFYNHQSPANCFCNMDPDRFRKLAFRIEKMFDRKMRLLGIKDLILFRNKLWRVQELGMGESLKRGIRVVIGR